MSQPTQCDQPKGSVHVNSKQFKLVGESVARLRFPLDGAPDAPRRMIILFCDIRPSARYRVLIDSFKKC